MKTNTKKLLSILLALMMMLSVVPFYASAAEALSTSNVTQWPTITYINGGDTIYYGQVLGETIKINDDEIVLDSAGNQVAGHFEFTKPTSVPIPKENQKASIVFVPDDTTAYSGFKKLFCADVTYNIAAVDLVPVDENDTVPTATAVEQGALLETSILTQPKFTNPYYPDDPDLASAEWTWSYSKNNPASTIVNESGYYTAQFITSYYESFIVEVYVEVIGNAVATTITEAPTVADMTYGTTRNDIVLVGGKAMAGDVEVPGKFTLDYTDDTVMNVGTYNLAITFTPDDTESYLPSTGTATVTVNKSNYKFVDENGDVCVPEITVPYGTSLEDVSRRIRAFIADVSKLTGADVAYISFPDNDATATLPVGTNTYTVRVRPSREGNSNYNTTDLQFVLTVEQTDVKVNILPLVGTIQVRKANLNDPTPTGTFAIYVDGQLLKDDVKLDSPVEWNPTVSKEYEIKAVYTPAENDPVNVEDVTITTIRNLERKITYISQVNGGNPSYLCGATVTLSAAVDPESFETWVITDANGNAVDLGVDLTNSNISFTMPDFDLIIETKTKGSSLGGGLDIDNIFGDMTEGDSDCWLINIINNIIAKMKQIITTVTELFRSIGDNT